MKFENHFQKLFLLAVVFATGFISCKKDKDPDPTPDIASPIITVSAPVDGDTLSLSSGISVTFSVTDNVGVRSLKVLATNVATGDTLSYSEQDPNAIIYYYSTSLTLTPASFSGPVQLSITAADGVGNSSNKQVGFVVTQ